MARDTRQRHALDSEHFHLPLPEISLPMQPSLANVKS
jgi:hypothetical protein